MIDLPEDLVAQVATGNCVAFVGAGLSRSSGLPDWKALLRDMITWARLRGVVWQDEKDLTSEIEGGNLLLVAEELRERLGKESFQKFIADTFRRPDLKPNDTHLTLATLPFAAVFTTNYDRLLESAYVLKSGGNAPHVFTHRDFPELSAALRGGEFYILKLHGTADQIESIVLSHSDYRELALSNSAYLHHISTVFSTKTVLFLGYGLGDPDLLLALDELREISGGYSPRHYALMHSPAVSPFKQRRFEKDYGVIILPSGPSVDHREVQEALTYLKTSLATYTRPANERTANGATSDLTRDVREWLQAVKYAVTEVTHISPHKTHFMAALTEGILDQQVSVYCFQGEITAQDLADVAAENNGHPSNSWLITDTRISPRATQSLSLYPALKTFTFAQFLRSLVWNSYFDTLEKLASTSRIQDLYVETACYKNTGGGDDGKLRDRYPSLSGYVQSWFKERGTAQLLVLGEFGSGKTWFCNNLAITQLERFLSNPSLERLPLLITLRMFAKAMTAQQLINDALLEQYKLPFVGSAYEVFQGLNRQGKLLLILDGFDEMASRVDHHTIVNNFWELAKLVSPNSKVVMTSRTEYFRRSQEAEYLFSGQESAVLHASDRSDPQFEVIHIEPLTNAQIYELITRRVEPGGNEIAKQILRSPALAELARKPIPRWPPKTGH